MNKPLTFGWAGSSSLGLELSKPLKNISIEFEPHGKPMFVTLWRQDGTGLRLFSKMHDVAQRKEIGIMQFESVSSGKNGEVTIEIPRHFEGRIAASKLVIEESGTIAESGVVLHGSDGREIVIVPADFPCFLAIKGLPLDSHTSKPEYPLQQYHRVALS